MQERGIDMDFFENDKYHVPNICAECGGEMIYKGVGEYQCEQCKAVVYDDYGKVRLYVEQHPGATISDTEAATGVPHKVIRQLLREDGGCSKFPKLLEVPGMRHTDTQW